MSGKKPSLGRGLAELSQAPGVAEDGFLQCGLDPPVDESDRQRLVGLDPARGEQEVLGARRADEFNQPSRLGMAVDETEPRGSDGKMRVRGAEPQIAGERQAKRAAKFAFRGSTAPLKIA